jgi:hypothetical protein
LCGPRFSPVEIEPGGSGALLGFWLYPIWWRPPTPNLYVSSDYRVTVVAVGVAVGVVAIDHFAISDTG